MASRVNTKFVAILAGVLVVVGGLAMYAGYVALRKSGDDYARKGDAAFAEGDFKKASTFYGIAFDHDRTRTDWLDKWVEALESWTPNTRTEYSAQFQQTYMPVMKTVAQAKQRDVAAHDHYLSLLLDQFQRIPYSRAGAERLIAEADASLTFFTYTAEDDTSWNRLRRYRGLANSTILAQGGTVLSGIEEQAVEDLEAALEADPGDTQAARGLLQLHDRKADDARVAKRFDVMKRERAAAREIVESFLADNPQSADGLVMMIGVEIDEAYERVFEEASRRGERAPRLDFTPFLPRLNELESRVRALENPSKRLLGRLRTLESIIDPEANLRRTESLMLEALARSPKDAELLFAIADINSAQRERTEALGYLDQLHALTPIPMSLDGLFQYYYQEQALATESRTHLEIMGGLEDTPENAAARQRELAAAKDARRRFAQLVPDTDSRLTMLDGLIAVAENDPRTALTFFQKYNTEKAGTDIEGLWHEAQVAAQLDRLGTARERLEQMLELQPENLAATLLLGQVSINLANYRRALDLFTSVLESDPANEIAQNGRITALIALGDEESGDPVRDALIESARIREGTALDAGDPRRALQFLEGKFEELGRPARLGRELTSLYLQFEDMAAARATMDRTIEANPDDQSLVDLRTALNAQDPTDVGIELIDRSEASPTDKLLAKHALFRRADRVEEADAVLDELVGLSPEHPGVLDLRLVRALRDGDIAEGERVAAIARRTNADQANGLTFQSRLLSSQGKPEEAMAALKQAVGSGAQDVVVYRLLALQQIQAGDLDGAIETYEQGLNVRPDDLDSIIGYLRTLVTAGEMQEAVQRARAMEVYGRRNPEFMDLWLRLEAVSGGPRGVAFAIQRRQRMLELDPDDRSNRIELARLYVIGKGFEEARGLIDELRAEKDELALVELDAKWHADQVTVSTPEGPRDGVTMARQVYSRYLVTVDRDEMTPAYVSMAQFMLNRGRPQVAIEALKEARELQDPNNPTADMMLGEVYAAVQEWELALETYKLIVEGGHDDEDRSFQKRVVESLLRLYRYDEAAREMAKIESLAPRDTTVRLQQAEIAMGLGNQAEALRLLDMAVNEAPSTPLVYIQRAKAKADDPALANDVLADLNQALRLNPDDWRTMRVRAGFYYQLGREEDAITDLKTAVRVNPGLDEVIFSLISQLADKGRDGEASTVAQEAIEARLGDTQLTTQVAGMFAEKGRWERAAAFYRQAYEKSQSTPVAMRLIDALLRTSPPNVREARQVFNTVALNTPNASTDPGIQASRAIIEFTQGERQQAESRMSEAFDNAVDDLSEVNVWAANVGRMFEGQPREQLLTFLSRMVNSRPAGTPGRDWLELFHAQEMVTDESTRADGLSRLQLLRETTRVPQIPRLAYRLAGRVYYSDENLQQAADVWREGLEKYPGDWEMLNNLAYMTSEKLGDPEAGLEMVEEALRVSPDNPQALDTKGAILVTLGRHGEARATLDRALRIARDLDTRISLWVRLTRVYLGMDAVPQASALLEQIRANVNVSPRRMERFGSDIEALESEIDSARGG